ncbi:hypothetical protein [Palleronia sp.]|uniref:hypothetical protein n=1 Tax=Palleronia sp. TaxID=1940284 RepID=UPI0035C8377F
MNQATNMLIQRHLGTYQSALTQWGRQVTVARDDRDAFRIASQKPAPHSLLRSLGSLTNSDRLKAERIVERQLEERLDRLERDGAEVGLLRDLQRTTQGAWPRQARRLETLARAAARPPEPDNDDGMEP